MFVEDLKKDLELLVLLVLEAYALNALSLQLNALFVETDYNNKTINNIIR